MAIKAPAAPPKTGPTFARLGGPTLAKQTLLLRGPRSAWHYCVSPGALQCFRGHIVPRLAKAIMRPGLAGNGRTDTGGHGALSELQTRGYKLVPHDMTVVAWGETRTAQTVKDSTYLVRWDGQTSIGQRVTYWADAWERPRVLGAQTIWERDDEGWLDFLLRCLDLVTPRDELLPEQVEIAIHPIKARLNTLLDREGKRADRLRKEALGHLPLEYWPEDYREQYADAAKKHLVLDDS